VTTASGRDMKRSRSEQKIEKKGLEQKNKKKGPEQPKNEKKGLEQKNEKKKGPKPNFSNLEQHGVKVENHPWWFVVGEDTFSFCSHCYLVGVKTKYMTFQKMRN